jgi:hypothetical protein
MSSNEPNRVAELNTVDSQASNTASKPSCEGDLSISVDLLPPHTPTEIDALRESISEHKGLRTPVVLDESGHIIDGRMRARICDELQIDWHKGAELVSGLTDLEKQALRIELNVLRRHTPPSPEQRRRYVDVFIMTNPSLSNPSIAKMIGVNASTVSRRKAALMQTHKLPEVQETVGLDGTTRKVNRQPRRITRTYVTGEKEFERTAQAMKVLGDDSPNGRTTPRLLRERAKQKEREELVAGLPTLSLTGVHHCDFRALEAQPESVDLVMTDVVWSKQASADWHDLAQLVAKWLKPDGLFATWIGNHALGDLISVFGQYLKYEWCFVVEWNSGLILQDIKGILSRWRPIPVFSRKDSTFGGFDQAEDLIRSSGPEKDFHQWQQSIPDTKQIVERLSRPEALVVDPCMGTGTTGVACLELGRRFLGCDIDETMHRIACNRIEEARQSLESSHVAEAGQETQHSQSLELAVA